MMTDKCRICGTEGETIKHIISSCTVLAQSEYKKGHDLFAKFIHMNLPVYESATVTSENLIAGPLQSSHRRSEPHHSQPGYKRDARMDKSLFI
jgi:hypothetical protein